MNKPLAAGRTVNELAVPAARNAGLDGLRGFAALSVALGHCLLQTTGVVLWGTRLYDFHAMPWPDIGLRLLSVLCPSDAAVMVFFVLSGHVLWGSFRRKKLLFFDGLPEYLCARIYRLFPVVIVSGLPLGMVVGAPASELVRNMLLLSHSLNGVLWSLQVEVVASVVLFVVWGLTKGNPWLLCLALIINAVAVPFWRGEFSVVFFPAFLLGTLISSLPARFWRNRVLLCIGFVVLVGTNVVLGHGGVDRCCEMAGATILVGAVANGRLAFLGSSIPRFLGAISYPFYLMHGIGLAAAAPFLGLLPPLPAVAVIFARAVSSIALTIPMAWLLHVFVEDPVLRGRPRFGVLPMRVRGRWTTRWRT